MSRGTRHDNGSVVMEFLMVLPIYFALMGGTFWIGELFIARDDLLISDRVASNHWGVRHDREFDKRNPNDKTMLERLNLRLFEIGTRGSLTESPIVYNVLQTRALAEPYSWAQTVGGKVTLNVPQPTWTHSWLHGYDDIWGETLAGVRKSSTVQDAISMLCTMTDEFVGMGLHSRVSEYDFLNVSLMRTKCSETAYRAFTPAQICHECGSYGGSLHIGVPVKDAVWYKNVYDEKFPYHDMADLNNLMNDGNRDDGKCDAHTHRDYFRFPSYVLWSQ